MQPINTHHNVLSPEYAAKAREAGTPSRTGEAKPDKTESARGPQPDAFRHETPESPGKYWVEPGPKVRFEPPTTQKAAETLTARAPESPAPGKAREADAPARGAVPARTDDRTAGDGAKIPERTGAKAAESGKPDKADDKKTDGDSKPDKEKETTVCNTDSVDQELEALRQRQQALKSEITAAGDDERAGEAKRELAKVERELAMKDNDSYRRAHARFTTL